MTRVLLILLAGISAAVVGLVMGPIVAHIMPGKDHLPFNALAPMIVAVAVFLVVVIVLRRNEK